MNKIPQFPGIRMIVAILFVAVGIAVGQAVLSLVLSKFSITRTGLANLLAVFIITPVVYLAYRLYVRYIERRDLEELGRGNAMEDFMRGALIGFGPFAIVIAIL